MTDLSHLFHVDEKRLDSTEAEDFESLWECETPPEEVADAAMRKRYIAFLKTKEVKETEGDNAE